MDGVQFVSLGSAVVALFWTIYQQYRINNICAACPFFPPNTIEEKKKKGLESIST